MIPHLVSKLAFGFASKFAHWHPGNLHNVIITGDGNNDVVVEPQGKGWLSKVFWVSTGGGSDTITIKTPPGSEHGLGQSSIVVVNGGSGNDIIHAGGGRDIIQGGAGARDTVIYDLATKGVVAYLNDGGVEIKAGKGGAAGDVLIGVERLAGSNYDDRLYGNSADNDLLGGPGNDILTGGAGRDHFVLGRGDGHDWVTDFTVGEDTVEIRRLDPSSIQQELTTRDGVAGLLIRTDAQPGYEPATMFLAGVDRELAPVPEGSPEPNWHDALLLA